MFPDGALQAAQAWALMKAVVRMHDGTRPQALKALKVRRSKSCRWATEVDEADRISAAHSRHIIAADAQLVPLGSTQAVCLSFEGQSFVLHQVHP